MKVGYDVIGSVKLAKVDDGETIPIPLVDPGPDFKEPVW